MSTRPPGAEANVARASGLLRPGGSGGRWAVAQRFARLMAVVLALLGPRAALAHSVSDSHLQLDVRGRSIHGTWRARARDLDLALRLDRDADGELSEAELRGQAQRTVGYLLSRLSLRTRDGRDCVMTPGELNPAGEYLVASFEAACAHAPVRLRLRYELFFDYDVSHRGRLRLRGADAEHSAVFTHIDRAIELELGEPKPFRAFGQYIAEGAWHIAIGYDHLLFLLTLLLPSVLFRRHGVWRPVERAKAAVVNVTRVVTAFTAAHSITLCLATLGWIRLHPQAAEIAIALSVAVGALNNLSPIITRRGWALAFAFGLVHGLGFASVLSDLSLGTRHLGLSLIGFNLGVELGQLALVALALPLLLAVRGLSLFVPVALRGGSVAILGLALFWAAQRGLGSGSVSSASASLQALPEAAAGGQAIEEQIATGQLSRAAAGLRELSARYRAAGDEAQAAAVELRAGDVALAQADLPAARQHYEQAARAFVALGLQSSAAVSHRGLASVASLAGDETYAARALRRAGELWLQVGDRPAAARDALALALKCRNQSRFQEARAALRQARELYEELGDPAGQARAWAALGHVAQKEGRLDEARQAYGRCLEFQATELALLQADTHANLGNVERQSARLELARRQYREALGRYVDLGRDQKAKRVRELLRRL